MSTRRAFIGTLTLGMGAVPPFVVAQRAGNLPRVALVFSSVPVAEMTGPDPVNGFARSFVHALRDLGYVEGRNIVIERRSAEGRLERMPALMKELVALKVDLIVATGPAAIAAQRATETIPIVALIDEPDTIGLAASLARPGRNVTGVTSSAGPGMQGKWLQLLKEASPKSTRVAVIDFKYIDSRATPGTHRRRHELEAAARVLGLTLIMVGVDTPEDFEPAFADIVSQHADALLVQGGAVVYVHRRRIIDFAAQRGLPALYSWRESVASGGLMFYGPNDVESFRRTAAYADKILKGVKPADLPFEQPTRFDLIINLKTAKVLGLTIPQTLLLRADEVIQ